MGDQNMPEKSIKTSLKRNKGKIRKAGSQTEEDRDEDFKIKKKVVEKSEVRRNPRRQVDVKNYEELEEPPDDRYVYCDFCEEVFVDDCAKCGQLFYLKDVEVPMGKENRAKCTVPKNTLAILPSPIHGLGVFAKVALKKGIKMGPYEGKITKVESTAGYSWKLRDGRLVDAADDKFSNWMRYINCARHVGEQNVVAFQYKGNLYYRTCSDIKVGEELLVYYGHSFAKNLGIDVRNYFKPKEEEINENPKCCPHCNYGYKDSDRLMYHIGLCKWNPKNIQRVPDKVFFCRFCPAGITNEELYKKHEIFCQKKKHKVVPEKTKRKGKKDRCEFLKKYNCDKCNYTTFRRSDLESHKRIHDDFFPFSCKICIKGFNALKELRVHMLKHLDMVVVDKTGDHSWIWGIRGDIAD
ncbi:histone-lysine N-methyltransferase PRDM9-like [Coccinella septempunctata]|uniref:histone-lysine N-methyltransferase PRDM9-like n=1 Tax=Coccinella septempunctata TaxID=41139 RepID=UPI001D0929D6|nr:histone-lysine N-methyltransferase PRDM9-like [Coccinella septempunctata]